MRMRAALCVCLCVRVRAAALCLRTPVAPAATCGIYRSAHGGAAGRTLVAAFGAIGFRWRARLPQA